MKRTWLSDDIGSRANALRELPLEECLQTIVASLLTVALSLPPTPIFISSAVLQTLEYDLIAVDFRHNEE